MSILEIILLIVMGLIIFGTIFAILWKKKHANKNEDDDGEES